MVKKALSRGLGRYVSLIGAFDQGDIRLTKASNAGVSVDLIMLWANWKSDRTFKKHFKRPINSGKQEF